MPVSVSVFVSVPVSVSVPPKAVPVCCTHVTIYEIVLYLLTIPYRTTQYHLPTPLMREDPTRRL